LEGKKTLCADNPAPAAKRAEANNARIFFICFLHWEKYVTEADCE